MLMSPCPLIPNAEIFLNQHLEIASKARGEAKATVGIHYSIHGELVELLKRSARQTDTNHSALIQRISAA